MLMQTAGEKVVEQTRTNGREANPARKSLAARLTKQKFVFVLKYRVLANNRNTSELAQMIRTPCKAKNTITACPDGVWCKKGMPGGSIPDESLSSFVEVKFPVAFHVKFFILISSVPLLSTRFS